MPIIMAVSHQAQDSTSPFQRILQPAQHFSAGLGTTASAIVSSTRTAPLLPSHPRELARKPSHSTSVQICSPPTSARAAPQLRASTSSTQIQGQNQSSTLLPSSVIQLEARLVAKQSLVASLRYRVHQMALRRSFRTLQLPALSPHQLQATLALQTREHQSQPFQFQIPLWLWTQRILVAAAQSMAPLTLARDLHTAPPAALSVTAERLLSTAVQVVSRNSASAPALLVLAPPPPSLLLSSLQLRLPSPMPALF